MMQVRHSVCKSTFRQIVMTTDGEERACNICGAQQSVRFLSFVYSETRIVARNIYVIYIYICIYMYTYIYIHYIYVHVHTHTYVDIYI